MTAGCWYVGRFSSHFARFNRAPCGPSIPIADSQTPFFKEIKMNKTTTIAVRAMTISLAAVIGCSAAHASNVSKDESATNERHQYVVRFADVDLSRIDGAMTVYGRIRQAASAVCGSLDSRVLGLMEKHRACVNQAIADAVASINRPLLSQYHQLRTKGDKAALVQLASN
jgi:UrcA family protein